MLYCTDNTHKLTSNLFSCHVLGKEQKTNETVGSSILNWQSAKQQPSLPQTRLCHQKWLMCISHLSPPLFVPSLVKRWMGWCLTWCLLSDKWKACSSNNSQKCSSLRGTTAFRKAVTTFTQYSLWSRAKVSPTWWTTWSEASKPLQFQFQWSPSRLTVFPCLMFHRLAKVMNHTAYQGQLFPTRCVE